MSLNAFDMYITIGNTANPVVTDLNGLSFSIKFGVLQNISLQSTLAAKTSVFPASTIVGNKRFRQ